MFENLEVYQKAIAFADEISGLTESFSKGNYYLIDMQNNILFQKILDKAGVKL
jgi:hypothetical protein